MSHAAPGIESLADLGFALPSWRGRWRSDRPNAPWASSITSGGAAFFQGVLVRAILPGKGNAAEGASRTAPWRGLPSWTLKPQADRGDA